MCTTLSSFHHVVRDQVRGDGQRKEHHQDKGHSGSGNLWTSDPLDDCVLTQFAVIHNNSSCCPIMFRTLILVFLTHSKNLHVLNKWAETSRTERHYLREKNLLDFCLPPRSKSIAFATETGAVESFWPTRGSGIEDRVLLANLAHLPQTWENHDD